MNDLELHIKVLKEIILEKKRYSYSIYKVSNDYKLDNKDISYIDHDITNVWSLYYKYHYLALQIYPEGKKL